VGNSRKLFALQTALLTAFAVGCGPAFHRSHARVPRPETVVERHLVQEPQRGSLPEDFLDACEVVATDEGPIVEQASCTADAPTACGTPVVEPPASNDATNLPADDYGGVVNPFRNSGIEGFATPDAPREPIPLADRTAEPSASDKSRETLSSPEAKADDTGKRAVQAGELAEPAPLDLPPVETAPATSAEPPVPPTDRPQGSAAASKPVADDRQPPILIAAQNFAFLPGAQSAATTSGQLADATPGAPSVAPPAAAPPAAVPELPPAAFPATAVATMPQTVAAASSVDSATSTPPAPSTPTVQIAVSPQSPVATIPVTAMPTAPNVPAQALVVIRIETAPSPDDPPEIARQVVRIPYPESASPAEPLPLEQPATYRSQLSASSSATAPATAWRRPKLKSIARENDESLVSKRVAQHLTNSLSN
jgi:hypothetical protein